ncbi:MAG: hypothetical protein ISEC1_P1868 [Thiomicrorhabdus sp.]|nr:MAG: hypothetical protein ISEC1_P1868 [Thiomicrorhabdus sp.]
MSGWSVPTSLNGSFELYGAQTSAIDELRLNLGTHYLVDNIDLTVSPVPEPSVIALMLGGLGLVGLMANRRRQA